MSDAAEAPDCKRCHQPYTIECGYEPSAHGFCWSCCDEIVARLSALRGDTEVTRRIAEQVLPHRSRAAADIALVVELVYKHVLTT